MRCHPCGKSFKFRCQLQIHKLVYCQKSTFLPRKPIRINCRSESTAYQNPLLIENTDCTKKELPDSKPVKKEYWCLRCDQNTAGLGNNHRYHCRPPGLKCDACQKSMTSYGSFRNHVNNCLGSAKPTKKEYWCLRCDQNTAGLGNNHRYHCRPPGLKCDACQKSMTSYGSFRHHVNNCLRSAKPTKKEYWCLRCDQNTAGLGNNHRYHCRPPGLKCDACQKSMTSYGSFREHVNACMRACTGNPPSIESPKDTLLTVHNCPSCPYSTTNLPLFMKHRKSNIYCQILIRRQELDQYRGSNGRLSCPRCHYSTQHSNLYRKHVTSVSQKGCMVQNKHRAYDRYRTTDGLYKCPSCPFSTKYLGNFGSHKENKLACQIYIKRQELDQYRGSNGQLSCPRCQYSSPHSDLFSHHVNSVSQKGCWTKTRRQELDQYRESNGQLSCPRCPYCTKYSSVFRRHLNSMSKKGCGVRNKHLMYDRYRAAEGLYKCPSCPYSTQFLSNFGTHRESRLACRFQLNKDKVAALDGRCICTNCKKEFSIPRHLLEHVDRNVCKIKHQL